VNGVIETYGSRATSAHYARLGQQEREKIHDTIGFLRAATRGVVVDDENLALDVVEELGPTGDFPGHEHTLRHFWEPFYSSVADKGTYSQWVERGAATMEERAAKQVDKILEEHKPKPLPASIVRDLKKLVERDLAKIGV
jgi:trimethylamine--corrinoid protein Co-methyltransferase